MDSLVLDWATQYEVPLAGLLSLYIDDRLDASSPWLVLHLHVAKSGGATKLAAALHAIADLHLLFSGTSSTAHKIAHWTAVLLSRMMALPLRPSDPKFLRFTWFLRHSLPNATIPILLDWTGVQFETLACPLLQEFFKIRRPPSLPPLTIGLVFKRCRLAGQAIETLDALLRDAKASNGSDVGRLVNLQSLRRLDLSDNGLTVKALEAVATLLDHHDVHDVRLENALAFADSDDTVHAVASVLRSVFSPEAIHRPPVSVSLANNSLDPRYYQVIAQSLEGTTRSLRRLSLARTMSVFSAESREGCWQWLAAIMFATDSTADNSQVECELDLSGNPLYSNDLARFLQHLKTSQAIPFDEVGRALESDKPVWCRVNAIVLSYRTPEDYGVPLGELDPSVQYRIEAVDDNGFARVFSESMSPARWIKYESITALRIGDTSLPYRCPRFQSLVLDEMRVNVSLWHWLVVVGPTLRRLSTRHLDVSDGLPHLLICTPHLVHLDLEACRLSNIDAVLASIRAGHTRDLASLNLTGNPIGAISVQRLSELCRDVPDLPLRQLQLSHCHIGTHGLRHVEQILQITQSLEIIELDATTRRDPDDNEYRDQRVRLTASHENELLRVEPLSLRMRLAFLSLATHLPVVTSMDAPVANLVLAFAASSVTRHLLWS